MKRPEGFDPSGKPHSADSAKPARPPAAVRASAPITPRAPAASVNEKPARVKVNDAPTQAKAKVKPQAKAKSKAGAKPEAKPKRDRAAGHDLRKAEAARRRYERSEVRRFTRRSRRRRVTWLVTVAAFVVMGGLVTAAVYSPVLSLSHVTVEGSSRVKAADIQNAVKDQIGKPLALVDFDRIKTELSAFPLIRSYVTETVPPDTLLIRVSERAPIGAIETANGYSIVDPAGVVIESSADRPASLPLISLGSSSKTSPGFTAAVAVLLALPTDVLSRVDSVSAQTNDDVSLTLTGAGQVVIWGSAEKSALKARVLVALMKTQSPNAVVKYDVSAPSNPVVGPA